MVTFIHISFKVFCTMKVYKILLLLLLTNKLFVYIAARCIIKAHFTQSRCINSSEFFLFNNECGYRFVVFDFIQQILQDSLTNVNQKVCSKLDTTHMIEGGISESKSNKT